MPRLKVVSERTHRVRLEYREYIREHIARHKVPPTLQEIATHFKTWPNNVRRYIAALRKMGLLDFEEGTCRTMMLSDPDTGRLCPYCGLPLEGSPGPARCEDSRAPMTVRQAEILEFYRAWIFEHGCPPTLDEAALHFGNYKGNVQGIVSKLKAKGYIDRPLYKARSLVIVRPMGSNSCVICGRVDAPVAEVASVQ